MTDKTSESDLDLEKFGLFMAFSSYLFVMYLLIGLLIVAGDTENEEFSSRD